MYLNNAATTFPKPRQVLTAVSEALALPPANPYRSSISGGGDILSLCRANVGTLLGIADTERIFFASGATDALNRVFGGLDLRDVPVVISQTEHNSVLRPLYNNPVTAGNIHVVPCDGCGYVSAEKVGATLVVARRTEMRMPSWRATTRVRPYSSHHPHNSHIAGLFVLNHCSNVTGAVQDVEKICAVAHKHGFITVLDMSQSAGCLPVSVDEWGIDIAVFTGHKGLFGSTGTGGYYVSRDIPFKPLLYGGTGRDSSIVSYDGDYEYEVGTPNLPGLAGLNAGIGYVLARGIDNIAEKEHDMMLYIYKVLSTCSEVILYADDRRPRGPLLSFNIRSMKPADVGYILQNAYDITLRTGLHCSPFIHAAMGTSPHGTVRVSISDLTTDDEVEAFLRAIKENWG